MAGDVITTNPGEVHDGQPLAGASRRWRMVYFDAAVLAASAALPARRLQAIWNSPAR